ncbi:type IV toxin-antitoxin system AbiEi family antitoxin domain-containing protein [Proteocatella sphenisci]|uniref:type IV toxin-antitoxin system AbiEi family antitoxin domain-containing protein n=1 Tax=Proteocatella sphenisci TaxID=181070 RepID=UPI0004920082|nr:type IV toxin-antitoxin system AbiEi family antitoxin domain-containing protein [Proteocatella sphenisci]
MGHREKLVELIKKNNGLLLTKDAEAQGIPRKYLSILNKEGLLERVAQGVYLSPDAFEDKMYIIQARAGKAIFSHETALYLHDLADRDPIELSVTVPYGYNASNLKCQGIKVHKVKKELHELGVIEMKTMFDRPIRVYDKERTICDIICNRNNMDISILNDALKRYMRNKEKNINQLLKYAKELRIYNITRKYAEMFQ